MPPIEEFVSLLDQSGTAVVTIFVVLLLVVVLVATIDGFERKLVVKRPRQKRGVRTPQRS